MCRRMPFMQRNGSQADVKVNVMQVILYLISMALGL